MKLQLLTLNEAHSSGVPLLDGHKHAVYHQILALSSLHCAKTGQLFSYRHEYDELKSLGPEQILQILNTLVDDSLVLPLLNIVYHPERNRLHLQPVFIAKKENSSETLGICDILLDYAQEAVCEYIDGREWLDHESLWRDFEMEVKVPEPERVYSDSTIFPIEQLFDISALPLALDSSFIEEFKQNIIDRLLKVRVLSQLEGLGYLVTNSDIIHERYNIALKFIKTKILPTLKKIPSVDRKLKMLSFEETIYWEENSKEKKTVHFDRQRIQLALEYCDRFGGGLASKVALLHIDNVSELFQREYNQLIQGYYTKLHEHACSDKAPISGYSQEEGVHIPDFSHAPQESIQQLKATDDILFVEMHEYESIKIAFIEKSKDAILGYLKRVSQRPSQKSDILMLKRIIESAEAHEIKILDSNTSKARYGQLMRSIYEQYVPWLYRIFIFLRIPFLQDKAFAIAKRKINHEHHRQKERNLRLRRESEIRWEARRHRLDKLKHKNTICDILDIFYLEESIRIPTVGDLLERLNVSQTELQTVIMDDKFLLIPQQIEDSNFADNLIFYPVDNEWRRKAQKIAYQLNMALSKGHPKLDPQTSDRYRLLHDYLKRHIQKISGKKIIKAQKDLLGELMASVKPK